MADQMLPCHLVRGYVLAFLLLSVASLVPRMVSKILIVK